MAVDGYLNFDTRINTAGFQKGLSSIGGGLDSLKSQLKGIASAVGLAFGIRGLVQFGKTAIETAAEVNAANSAMTQTFGNLEQAARDAMQRVSEESGIMQTRLQGVGTGIYAFAKASGMDAVSALSMMEDALRVAADSAAYYDRSLEDTSASLQSFLKGNFANDAALGVSCTETTRNIAANKLYAKSFKDLSEAQKQLTLLQMVKDANALSGAEGQAAREADGWANVIGNLKETWRQLVAEIGQPVLHVATAAVKQLTVWLSALTDAAHTASSALSALMGWENDQTAATAAVSGNIAQSVTEQNNLTDAVKETAKEQEKTLTTYDELHKVSAPETSADTGNQSAASVPAAIDEKPAETEAKKLPAKLQKMLEPIKLAWETNSPQLIAEAKNAAENIKKVFGSIGASIASVWTNGSGERLFGNLIILAGDLLGVIGDIAGALNEAWNDGGRGTALVQSYFDRWNSLLELIHIVTESARTAWNGGRGAAILGNILEILKNINDIWTNLQTQFAAAWDENDVGVEIFDSIFGIVESVTDAIERMTEATAEFAAELDFTPGLESVNGLLDAIEGLTDTVMDALASAYEEILLPLGKWVIEDAAPAAIDLLSSAIEVLTAMIDGLKPVAKWLWDNFLSKVAEWTGGVIVGVLKALAAALRMIAAGISKLQPVGKWLMDKFMKFGDGALLKVLEDLAIVLGSVTAALVIAKAAMIVWTAVTSAATAVSSAFGAVMAFITSPIGLIVIAIGAVIAIGILLAKHWEEIKQIAADVWESITEAFSKFLDNVKAIFSQVVSFLKECWEAIKNAFSAVGQFFGDAFTAAWDAIKKVFSVIGRWFADRWQDIRRPFLIAAQFFRNVFAAAWDAIKKAFSVIGKWFSDRWEDVRRPFLIAAQFFRNAFAAAWAAIQGAFSVIGKWFSDRWKDVQSAFAAVGSWFSSTFNAAWNGIKKAFSSVGQFFREVWDSITGVFNAIGGWFSDKFQAAYNAITDIFGKLSGFFEGIWNGIKNILNTVLAGIESMLNGIIHAANKIISFLNGFSVDIPEWVPKIGGKSIGFHFEEKQDVSLPRLATGTVVPANFGEFKAILGDNKREPEIVSPVSTMKQAFLEAMREHGGSQSGAYTFVMQLVCDGKKLAETVKKYEIRNGRVTNGG